MQIQDRHVVNFHYTLKDSEGNILDSSDGNDPLAYLHGAGNIIPGLENALSGKKAGDQLSVTVEPQEGYGQVHPELRMVVNRKQFEGGPELEVGLQFQAETEQGMHIYTITNIDGDDITIDGNHALAGQTLHFDVEITDVREASKEELDHGHVHGPGGHEH